MKSPTISVGRSSAPAGPEQLDPDVPRLAVILPVVPGDLAQRHAADGGDPVIALLPVDHAVHVAERFEGRVRELLLAALDLLQAQHVGPLLLEQTYDLADPQADRIDVPGSNRDHGGGIGMG